MSVPKGRKAIDLTGKRFGMLDVYKRFDTKNRQSRWLCKCDCGNTSTVYRSKLVNGESKSCGCQTIKHNMYNTRMYRVWNQMKSRCINSNHPSFERYGGRGITVCERWLEFQNFYSDMYEAYEEHCEKHGERDTTIERIDNNKGYNFENCTWATRKVQRRNCSHSKYYKYKGKTITTGEISDKYGIKYATIDSRLRRGWSIEKIIETPVNTKFRRKVNV